MRKSLAALAAAGILWPGVALADNVSQCVHLMRQIEHYETMVDRAEARGSKVWADKTGAHVEVLQGRLDDRCPKFADKNEAAEFAREMGAVMAELARLGAKAALTYFTFGAF